MSFQSKRGLKSRTTLERVSACPSEPAVMRQRERLRKARCARARTTSAPTPWGHLVKITLLIFEPYPGAQHLRSRNSQMRSPSEMRINIKTERCAGRAHRQGLAVKANGKNHISFGAYCNCGELRASKWERLHVVEAEKAISFLEPVDKHSPETP